MYLGVSALKQEKVGVGRIDRAHPEMLHVFERCFDPVAFPKQSVDFRGECVDLSHRLVGLVSASSETKQKKGEGAGGGGGREEREGGEGGGGDERGERREEGGGRREGGREGERESGRERERERAGEGERERPSKKKSKTA